MRKLHLTELDRATVEEYKHMPKTPIVVVLDNIRSGMNVGSFFRTADALLCTKIILCGITPQPPHKEITKSAIGATQSVDWEYESDIAVAVNKLKEKRYTIIGIEQTDVSQHLWSFDWKHADPLALVFGNEVEGVSDEILPLLDYCIEVPQYGTKHSLNVSVCGGIVLWEASKRYLKK